MNVTSTNVSEEAGMGTEQVCVQRSPAVMEKEVVAFISTVNEIASGMSLTHHLQFILLSSFYCFIQLVKTIFHWKTSLLCLITVYL